MNRSAKPTDDGARDGAPANQPGVFIVDDDQSARDSLKWLITNLDFPVEAFESAELFLESVSPEQPGCLILDLQMPKMDGFQLLHEMKARAYKMPVIMITGHGDWETGTRAKQAGAMAYLEKPYDDEDVLFFVKKALAEQGRDG